MCEMLVRVVDKRNHDDPAKDARLRKRGDVVVVCEDGHPWTPKELANPEWRVLRVPGMSVAEGRMLTDPPVVLPGLGTPRNRRSAMRLDLDAHPTIAKALEAGKVTLSRAGLGVLSQLRPGVAEQARPKLRGPDGNR